MTTSAAQRSNGPAVGAVIAAVVAIAMAVLALPALASAASPSIDSESVAELTSRHATLQARINPEGQNVRYQFQLAGDPSEYASEIECPEPSPGPLACVGKHVEGALPIGLVWGNLENPLAAQPVSLDLESAGVKLKPDTTYHYRVIAAPSVPSEDTIEWEGPPVYGADQTFTTLPAGAGPPSIESESVSHITPTDATLEAQINTDGLETTYEFQLFHHLCPPGTEPLGCKAPIQRLPLPTGKLLGSFIGQSVSVDLNSVGVTLYPDNEYDHRVVASNAAGETEGTSHTFVTPEDGVQPLDTTPSGSSSSGSGLQVSGSSALQPGAGLPSMLGAAHRSSARRHHKHRRHIKHQRHRSRTARHKHHKA
jgi:hypothetical protein